MHLLVDAGDTVVAVEQEMDVVVSVDWVMDPGPGGGDAGGRIVAVRPPAEVALVDGSRTAPYLAARLATTR